MPWKSYLWAKVFESAARTARFSRKAGSPPMLNQTMAYGDPVVSGNFLHEVPLCPNSILCFGQGKSTRNTTYMCINNHTLSQTESATQDNVRRFSADSWQGGQFLHCLRNIPVELINKFAATSMNVFGLRSKESGCFHCIFEFCNARRCHFVRVRPPFKEVTSH